MNLYEIPKVMYEMPVAKKVEFKAKKRHFIPKNDQLHSFLYLLFHTSCEGLFAIVEYKTDKGIREIKIDTKRKQEESE